MSKWALYIQEALKIVNKNVVRMTTTSLADHYIKEGILQKQFKNLPELPFVYQIGDYVVLKSLATIKGKEEKERPGFKRSLGKIFFYNQIYHVLFQWGTTKVYIWTQRINRDLKQKYDKSERGSGCWAHLGRKKAKKLFRCIK